MDGGGDGSKTSSHNTTLRSAGGSAHVGFLGIGICGERVVRIGE